MTRHATGTQAPHPGIILAVAAVLAVLAGLLAAAVPASASPAADPATLDGQALAWAETHALGHPYAWGGAGPGSWDCSGLVMNAYQAADGIQLPHSTYAMLADPHLHQVPIASAPPGALLFFGTGHVELAVQPGVSFGALHTGTLIGYHNYGGSWVPTAAYIVSLNRTRS